MQTPRLKNTYDYAASRPLSVTKGVVENKIATNQRIAGVPVNRPDLGNSVRCYAVRHAWECVVEIRCRAVHPAMMWRATW